MASQRLTKHSNACASAQSLCDAGRYAEAAVILKALTDETPSSTQSWLLYGMACYSLDQGSGTAEQCFRNVLARDRKSAAALRGLGLMSYSRNNVAAARSYFESALLAAPDYLPARLSLGQLCRDLMQYQDAIAHLKASLSKISHKDHRLSPPEHLAALVWLAVLYFLEGNHDANTKLLAQVVNIKHTGHEDESLIAYLKLLVALELWWNQHRGKNCRSSDIHTIYAIGESHILPMHHQTVSFKGTETLIKGNWILGCKQWHLANPEHNNYKIKFERILKSIPRESTILMVVGEIDCREDTGIIDAASKLSRTVNEVAKTTIDGFLLYVKERASEFGHTVIIWGVPATNVNLAGLAENIRTNYLDLLKFFNRYLAEASNKLGIGFVDVFSSTNVSEGAADGSKHIDTRHITPESVKEAFANYYVHASKHENSVEESNRSQTPHTGQAPNSQPTGGAVNSNHASHKEAGFFINGIRNARKGTQMAAITIDNIEYDTDTFSPEAKEQLQSIRFVDSELARLNAQAAVLQTARMAYVNALKQALAAQAMANETIRLN